MAYGGGVFRNMRHCTYSITEQCIGSSTRGFEKALSSSDDRLWKGEPHPHQKQPILTDLLQTPPLPKYLPPPLSRALKNTPYNSILKTYPAPYNLTEKDVKAFTADGNMGLVHQALEKSVRWRMKELTNTYVALGLGEMCDMVGVGREE